jgi:hypothetical protein
MSRATALVSLVLLLATSGAAAQDSTRGRNSAVVHGVVFDSVSLRPLRAAVVQIVSDTNATLVHTARSDSLGRFVLAGVADGAHTLGFFHPYLDSLGIEAPQRSLRVRAEDSLRADLAVPSPMRLLRAICPVAAESEVTAPTAVLVGVVREAMDGSPIAGAVVTMRWLEVSVSRSGVTHAIASFQARTQDNGWYATCGVPRSGVIAVSARRGNDSTDTIELHTNDSGLARGDLYLAPSLGDSALAGTSQAPTAGSVRNARGRLTGLAVTGTERKPLAGVRVQLAGRAHTVTNDQGEWTLPGIPLGTRRIEARALGFLPTQLAVHVRPDASPVTLILSPLYTLLDTMTVTATRRLQDERAGFEHRRRSGTGRYLTGDEIARRRPIVLSDLLARLPGVRVELLPDMGGAPVKQFLVRGNTAEWCGPAIYVNGMQMRGFTADDLDSWARPERVVGVEVYPGLGAPPQFQDVMTGCGSIVLWLQ